MFLFLMSWVAVEVMSFSVAKTRCDGLFGCADTVAYFCADLPSRDGIHIFTLVTNIYMGILPLRCSFIGAVFIVMFIVMCCVFVLCLWRRRTLVLI